jgi:hypothetical protein
MDEAIEWQLLCTKREVGGRAEHAYSARGISDVNLTRQPTMSGMG